MSNTALRSGLIRLAYAKPSLRPTLLPLITKHAAGAATLEEVKKAALAVANAVAKALGGKVSPPKGRADDDGYTTVRVPVVVPDLPSIGSDEGEIEVELTVFEVLSGSAAFRVDLHYYLAPRKLQDVAMAVGSLVENESNTIEEAVSEGVRVIPKLSALLTPVRVVEAMRRNSGVVFDKAIPDMKAWLQTALVQSGVVGPVKVWGHPLGGDGKYTTDAGSPYAAERIVIEGLIGKDEGRDIKRSQEVLANTRKVLTKALSRFYSNGVVAKLSSKPAFWSAYTYNTTVILYFKEAPVENMKLAAGDMDAELEADADPTSHDQNLPEHYYFNKGAAKGESVEAEVKQFASPKSKDQNKPESYYGLPPKGKQAARPLAPGVHLVEDLSVLGPNFRLVYRELGSDYLGSEQVPGYYLDLGGLLKLVVKTPKQSPAGEAQAKKVIANLLRMMKAGSVKTAAAGGWSAVFTALDTDMPSFNTKTVTDWNKVYKRMKKEGVKDAGAAAHFYFEYRAKRMDLDGATKALAAEGVKPPSGYEAEKQAAVKVAAGPDSTGRNWKKHTVSGIPHWIWQGRPGEPIKQFMVIENTAPFGKYYKMTVKLEDGTFLQTVGQKLKPTEWFKRAAEVYSASQGMMLDFSDMPEKWKPLNGPAPKL